MKRIILCIAAALVAGGAFGQAKETVADYFYPADTTLVSYTYSPDPLANAKRITTRMELPNSTAKQYKAVVTNELTGDEKVMSHLMFTDTTLTLGVLYSRNTYFNTLPDRAGHFYNFEALRLPAAREVAEWETTFSMGGDLYAKKLIMKSERVTLPLIVDRIPCEVAALRVTAEIYDRFGNRFPDGDYVEIWALGKGLILKYNTHGDLQEYSSSITNPPTTIEQLNGLQ